MKSLNEHRLKDNPKEAIFLELATSKYYTSLEKAVSERVYDFYKQGKNVDPFFIVNTTIQWLGSHVGQSFLREAEFKYTLRNKKELEEKSAFKNFFQRKKKDN